jgi:hypothetical protein
LRRLHRTWHRPYRPETVAVHAACPGESSVRDFLESKGGGVDSHPEKSHTRSLLLYCLPSSVTEYLAASQKAVHVRSVLLNQSTSASDATVVACYDPNTGTIVGGDKETVLAALENVNVKHHDAAALFSLS